MAPTYYQPVIRREGNQKVLDCIRWGIKLHNVNVINTRSDSISKSFWSSKHRCVVLCQGYYEWSHSPHYIDKSGQLLYLAGLYSTNQDGGYSIITINASQEVASVHNRMPMIFGAFDQVQKWLDNEISIDQIQPINGLSLKEVSTAVNKTGKSSRRCIEAVKGKTKITDFFKPATK